MRPETLSDETHLVYATRLNPYLTSRHHLCFEKNPHNHPYKTCGQQPKQLRGNQLDDPMQSSAKQNSLKLASNGHQKCDTYTGELPHLMWGPPATKNEEKVDLLHGLQPVKTSLQCQLKRRIYADGISKVQK